MVCSSQRFGFLESRRRYKHLRFSFITKNTKHLQAQNVPYYTDAGSNSKILGSGYFAFFSISARIAGISP